MPNMRILAIETSCDETALSLVEAEGGLKNPQFKILKNLVASQIKIHQPFGGIVPNLAKREHIKNLPILWQRIMNNELGIRNLRRKKPIIHNSKFIIPTIDLIAVTVGPGLEPCLWTGINFAKELQRTINNELKIRGGQEKTIIHNSKFIIPLIGVSHLEGHLYSFLLSQKRINSKFQIPNLKNLFPAIALIVSGGHTILLLMDNLTRCKKLGETRDDAVGECFDKVARLLKLPYPGGPEIERMAQYGNPASIDFPRPMINQKNFDFSFSGLKTAVLYYLRDNKNVKLEDVAASFQAAAFDVLIAKTFRAAKEFKAKSILISGGVAANKALKTQFNSKLKTQNPKLIFWPAAKKFCTDNAAMIAVAGYVNHLQKKKHKLIAQVNLTL